MLLDYGNTIVESNWLVNELKPTGYCRIYYIHEGDVEYESVDKKIKLRPKYLYIMPSVKPYLLSRNTKADFICTYFHLDPAPYFVNEIFMLDSAKNTLIHHYIEAMRSAISFKKTEIVHNLSSLFWMFCSDKAAVKKASEPIGKVISYIVENLSEKLDISNLSEIAGYNSNYFIELFRKETGVSPHQYIIRQRLQKAIMLLKENHSVSETAELAGFGDSNSLSRAFKAKFGVPPSQFHNYKVNP